MANPKKVVDRFALDQVEALLKRGLEIQARFPGVMQKAMTENRSGLKDNEVHNRAVNDVADDWSDVRQGLIDVSWKLVSTANELVGELGEALRDRSGMLDYDPNDPYELVHAFAREDDRRVVFRADPETGHPQAAFDTAKLKRWHDANVAWLKRCLALVKKYQRVAAKQSP